MHPDLERLLDLQKRDLALAEVDARLKALLDEVASLDGELAKSRADGDEARKALQAGVKRREELEAKVESLRVLQERRIEQHRQPREYRQLDGGLFSRRHVPDAQQHRQPPGRQPGHPRPGERQLRQRRRLCV